MRHEEKERRLQNLFGNKRFLMALSLFLAVIVWVLFVVVNGEDQEIVVTGVPVQPVSFEGTIAEQLGLEPFWSGLATGLENLTVSVTVTSRPYENITARDLYAELVTSSVNSSGEHTLEIRVTPKRAQDRNRFTIVSVTPASVSLYFERPRKLEFELTAEVEGEIRVPEGYYAGDILFSRRFVSISGPASHVNAIAQVKAVIVPAGPLAETTVFENVGIVPVDAYGDIPPFLTVAESEPINATVPVWKRARLRPALDFINVPGAYLSAPPRYAISPASVRAALPEATLDALSPEGVYVEGSASPYAVGTVDFHDLAPGHGKFTFSAADLKEIVFLDGTQAFTARVDMEGMDTVSLTLRGGAITALGDALPEAAPRFRDVADVTVVGPEEVVANLRPEHLAGQVEFTRETPSDAADYPVAIRVLQDDGMLRDDCWVYGNYKARVR